MNKSLTKLFEYRGIDILIDFKNLFQFNGQKKEKYSTEKEFGNLLTILSMLAILISTAILLLEGKFTLQYLIKPENIFALIIYLSIIPLVFGSFYKRDRNILELNQKKSSLYKLFINQKLVNKNIKALFLNEYIDLELSLILNKLINQKHDYTKFLFEEILKDSRISNIISRRLGLDPEILKTAIGKFEVKHTFDEDYINFFTRLLNEAITLQTSQINIYILMIVLIKYYYRQVFVEHKITDIEIEALRKWYSNSNKKSEYEKKWRKLSKLKPAGDINKTYTSTATPTLDKYGESLTSNLSDKGFNLTIGRDLEMNNLLDLLQRESSTFVYILGENGVGKNSFIKHLATRMVVEDVPEVLKDSRLICLNFPKIISSVNGLEELKSVLMEIFREVVRSGNIILIAEDFTSLFNFRDNLKDEAITLLTSLLDNKLNFIALDQPADYQKYIKSNSELASKFDILELKEVDSSISLQILADEAMKLEKQSKIDISFSAIKRVTDYAYKFDYEKKMPQKGLDLLKEALILARNKTLNYLDSSIVEELLFQKLGIKVGSLQKDEQQILSKLEENLKERVVGQPEAIAAITSAIKRSRSGLTNQKKPLASFLFYGPTGVGKTELAKAIADLYYGSENMMIRLDMSEYQEKQNLIRIIGGYNSDGTFTKGFLADSIRSKPFSLVLLDEIEKANPKVLDLFLSVLDDGYFKDGLDRKIDFTNTVIIMTSNVGSKDIQKLFFNKSSYEDTRIQSVSILSNHFRPEFLNRFDKLILFRYLSLLEVSKIVEKFMVEINNKLSEKGILIHWDNKTLEELAKAGYNPIWGARELRRVVQERIEDLIADKIILGEVHEGDEVFLEGLTIKSIK